MDFVYCWYLRQIASGCKHATEFGVHSGRSTRALMESVPVLVSYDIKPPIPSVKTFELYAEEHGCKWTFHQESVLEADPIKPTDMLFVDDLHTGNQVRAELERHAGQVKRFICFDDTVVHGEHGEGRSAGIRRPIEEFIEINPQWRLLIDDRRGPPEFSSKVHKGFICLMRK